MYILLLALYNYFSHVDYKHNNILSTRKEHEDDMYILVPRGRCGIVHDFLTLRCLPLNQTPNPSPVVFTS